MYVLCLQIVIDFQDLQQRLRDGTSEFCCFDNIDVLVENAVFQSSKDAASTASRIFVRNMEEEGGEGSAYCAMMNVRALAMFCGIVRSTILRNDYMCKFLGIDLNILRA